MQLKQNSLKTYKIEKKMSANISTKSCLANSLYLNSILLVINCRRLKVDRYFHDIVQ